jgi:hypothetical protein
MCVCVCVCARVCLWDKVKRSQVVDLDMCCAVLVDVFCDYVTIWLLRGLYYLWLSMFRFV